MAIIDRNTIFFEGPLTATAQGQPVNLGALKLPGRMEPMPMRVSVTRAFLPEEVQSITLTLQEADDPAGPFTAVPGAVEVVPGTALTAGARLFQRFLPRAVRKSVLRLSFTVSTQTGKSVSTGSIFAALMREEDLPYEPALQVK